MKSEEGITHTNVTVDRARRLHSTFAVANNWGEAARSGPTISRAAMLKVISIRAITRRRSRFSAGAYQYDYTPAEQ